MRFSESIVMPTRSNQQPTVALYTSCFSDCPPAPPSALRPSVSTSSQRGRPSSVYHGRHRTAASWIGKFPNLFRDASTSAPPIHGEVDDMRSESVVATGSSEASGDLLVLHGVLHVHGDCLLIHSDSTDSDSTDECLNPSIRFSADGSASRFQVAAPRCIHQRGAASGIDSVAPCGGPPLPCEVSSRASHTAGFESPTVPPVIQR